MHMWRARRLMNINPMDNAMEFNGVQWTVNIIIKFGPELRHSHCLRYSTHCAIRIRLHSFGRGSWGSGNVRICQFVHSIFSFFDDISSFSFNRLSSKLVSMFLEIVPMFVAKDFDRRCFLHKRTPRAGREGGLST